MKSRLILAIVFLFCLPAPGCGGGNGDNGGGGGGSSLILGSIVGPSSFSENSNAEFSIAASGDTGITYMWASNPATAGSFMNQTSATATFHASSVSSDIPVTIRVTVSSDHRDPVLKSCNAIIRNLPAAGWTRTWGGTDWDAGYGIASDDSGNIYVTGVFLGTYVDFDPGTGHDLHSSSGGFEAFLTKYNENGVYQWTRTWGGSLWDQGYKVIVVDSASIYVTGCYQGTSDFDPGYGYDWHTANGDLDAFVSKFDSSGAWQWTRTWGGTGWDKGIDVASDTMGSIYVTGTFADEVDFDPGPGTNIHYGWTSATFLSKFNPSGDFLWARTWLALEGHGVAADAIGNIYVAGTYAGDIDFDPGNGVDVHTSLYTDIYLSKLDTSGGFHWARSWGGWSDDDDAQQLAIDSSGNVYVTGFFSNHVDFDPGSGVDMHVSDDSAGEPSIDAFVSKFDTYGDYQWAATWGGAYTDRGHAVFVDDPGFVYVTGYFVDVADFCPGEGVATLDSNGGQDFYLTQLGPSGSYKWTVTLGGTHDEAGWGVYVDSNSDIYMTGLFRTTVDFNPGTAVSSYSSEGDADVFLTKFLN